MLGAQNMLQVPSAMKSKSAIDVSGIGAGQQQQIRMSPRTKNSLRSDAQVRERNFNRYFEERKKAGSDILLPNTNSKKANDRNTMSMVIAMKNLKELSLADTTFFEAPTVAGAKTPAINMPHVNYAVEYHCTLHNDTIGFYGRTYITKSYALQKN